jgi:hypothetical protein
VITGERAGITKQVTLARDVLTGWEIYPLPIHSVNGTTQLVPPPLVELALAFICPLFGRVASAGCEIHEEWFVGHSDITLDP